MGTVFLYDNLSPQGIKQQYSGFRISATVSLALHFSVFPHFITLPVTSHNLLSLPRLLLLPR